MDKIQKALRKLSPKERKEIKTILLEIEGRKFDRMDIKKLKGNTSIYRVRKGKLRVIFLMDDLDIRILSIERRSDVTYQKY